MKPGLHPKYAATQVTCSCGNTFMTRSTSGVALKVEVCSACHPFFTGQQKFVDTAGRVEKFLEKVKKTEARKATAKAAADKKAAATEKAAL
jgi:large subunit ribosomal protein L31